MYVKPLELKFNAFDQMRKIPDIDTKGGTIMNIDEREEIDPIDGCKVQVIVYRILSADGNEEYTTTTRRKLKVNCTQSLRRLEMTDGKEAKVEEKTELITGDLYGLHDKQVVSDNQTIVNLSKDDPQAEQFINNIYKNSSFMGLLNQEKNTFLENFPDLFTEMRTKPKYCEMPSTKAETTINSDGSTTTKYHTSKSYSTHFSRQETFVNGVKKTSKCKYRAFLEYTGPNGGFKLKLKNSADDDLSEDDETEYDDLNSRIAPSEIPDNYSAFAVDGPKGSAPVIKGIASKRHDKAWHAVKELVDSEQRYVEKLRLLEEIFRRDVINEKFLDKHTIAHLFSNISSLYQFHNSHLLPQLMDRLREWQSSKKISDVVKKQAPFLKLYSEYTHNYKKATSVFEDCMRKKKRFVQIVQKIERMPECENLPLVSHLICPVQRVMRYQLLLQEYKKNLVEGDPDYEDTTAAVTLVLEAASHANEMMRKLDRYRNVLEVQEQLGNSVTLVSPSRELLKRAKIFKISSATNKIEDRVLFIFNDLFLLASERNLFGVAKFKMRAIFDGCYSTIYEGDNLERESSFYLRGTDGNDNGQNARPSRRVELWCKSQKEKSELMQMLWNIINDSKDRKSSFPKSRSTSSFTSAKSDKKICVKCESELAWHTKSIKCNGCQMKYCKKCFGNSKSEEKKARICSYCKGTIMETDSPYNNGGGMQTIRLDRLAMPASAGEILTSGYVSLKITGRIVKRFIVLRKNFCLYTYEKDTDLVALAMCPISGCEVSHSAEKNGFHLRHNNRTYAFITDDEFIQAKWMAVLDLAANAHHPIHSSDDGSSSGDENSNNKDSTIQKL
uniref:DH domain-containing protein n=1 Tax=Rhabditophanes sp. KR3021 TaxID=114890 RepID=A0AC35U825_9BILA